MRTFTDSLTFDRRFLYTFLLELLIIALVAIGVMAWVAAANTVADDIESFRTDIEQLGTFGALYQDHQTDELAKDVMTQLFLYSGLLIIYIIAVWTAIKYWIYKLLLKKKWSWNIYWRFALVTVVWSIISFYIFMAIQNAVFLILEANLRGILPQIILITVIVIEYLILYWLTIAMFSSIVLTGSMKEGLKGMWKGVRIFDRFVIPLLLSLAVFVVINIAMYLLGKAAPILFMSGFTIALIAYGVWARLYFMRVMLVLPVTTAHHAMHEPEHKPPHGKTAVHHRKTTGVHGKTATAHGKTATAHRKTTHHKKPAKTHHTKQKKR